MKLYPLRDSGVRDIRTTYWDYYCTCGHTAGWHEGGNVAPCIVCMCPAFEKGKRYSLFKRIESFLFPPIGEF